MLLLHVEEERAGHAVVAAGDVLEGRVGPIDVGALDDVGVLVEEAEAEDADGGRVGLQLLNDQVVVLAGFDEGTVFPHGMGDGLEGLLVFLAHGLQHLELPRAAFHGEFDEGVTGTAGRRRAQDLDLGVRQRRVDVTPLGVGIRHQLAVDRDLLGQGLEDLLLGQRDVRAGLVVGQDDAVEADLDLDHGDAVLAAGLELRGLDAARGIGDIGVLGADAGAEQLHAAAGAGALDHRGLEVGGLAELLGHSGGERKDGRGTDDPDLVARFGAAVHGNERHAGRRRDEKGLLDHGSDSALMMSVGCNVSFRM